MLLNGQKSILKIESQFYKEVIKIGKIIRDKRYTNTLWCLCNNYEEFLQFAKDLFLYKGLEIYGTMCEEERWIEDEYDWSYLFGVDIRTGEDEENDEYWEEAVDPINDTYEMKEKPNENEYPVVVHYDNYHKNVLWMSLNKLKE